MDKAKKVSFKKKVKELCKRVGAGAMALALVVAVAIGTPAVSLAEGTDGTTTSSQLTFNFEASEMFTWTNMMLDAMMPVVYITLGISLCFIIIGALKSAFRG